jgi:hypothetical protein
MMERLKRKWGITGTTQIVLIMVVFSLAGLSITQSRPIVFHLFGIEPDTPFWIKTVTYLASLFPLYQIYLLLFGALLGQFGFFWEKEKRLVRWFGRKLGLVRTETGHRSATSSGPGRP